jgi:hypothetical protein
VAISIGHELAGAFFCHTQLDPLTLQVGRVGRVGPAVDFFLGALGVMFRLVGFFFILLIALIFPPKNMIGKVKLEGLLASYMGANLAQGIYLNYIMCQKDTVVYFVGKSQTPKI